MSKESALTETQFTIKERKLEYKILLIDKPSSAFLDVPQVFSNKESEDTVYSWNQSWSTGKRTRTETISCCRLLTVERKVKYKGFPIDDSTCAFLDILNKLPVFSDKEPEEPSSFWTLEPFWNIWSMMVLRNPWKDNFSEKQNNEIIYKFVVLLDKVQTFLY